MKSAPSPSCPPPKPGEIALFGKRGVAKMNSYWIRTVIGVLRRGRKFGQTRTEGRWPCDDGGRDCNDAAKSQGTPRLWATTRS